jgi:ABC-2 type transport system ATP-binding protein
MYEPASRPVEPGAAVPAVLAARQTTQKQRGRMLVPMTNIIEVEGITKRFGDVRAVDRLSFTVPQGTITGFLGPNGAGKTTTLRMLLGLIRPTSGRATIAGRPYSELDRPFETVGAALETSSFHPGRRADDHLRVLATAAGIDVLRVDEVLAEVGLSEAARRRTRGFSLGMRQRLSLAAALLGQPRILILDEPANGLDPEGVHWLRRFLRSFADVGGTVLVSSHLLSEVSLLVDDVVIVAGGRLVTQASLAALSEQAAPGVVVRSPQSAELRAALAVQGIDAEAGGGGTLLVRGATTEGIGLTAAASGIAIYEMSGQPFDLEELFLELTTTSKGDVR